MTEAKTHREWAVALYNKTWELLEATAAEPQEIERTAFASLYHWSQVGGHTEIATGEWMLSRVYIHLGNFPEALRHAELAKAAAEHGENPDWLAASLAEAHARALAANGMNEEARAEKTCAYQLLEKIADPEDRALIESQLNDGPWFEIVQ